MGSRSIPEVHSVPAGFEIAYYDASHRYKINGVWVPSVTTVLDKALPKNLTGWAERLTVQGIIDLQSFGRDVTRMGSTAILGEMHAKGLRYYQARDAASDRGTAIHKAFESLCDGKTPRLRDYPVEHRGYIQALSKWWLAYQPEVLFAELAVGSFKHEFAGRLDLLARIHGTITVVDLKTSKEIRDSHHFQTAGYQLGVVESGYPPARDGYVLRVGEDGEYEYQRSAATEANWLALLESYRAQREFERTLKDVRGKAA